MEGYVWEEGRLRYDLGVAASDYPSWEGPPRRSLVICTRQRSGSTLLGEAIVSAGGLGCPLEYFHSGFRPSFESRWGASDIRAYAEAVHRFRTDPSGVFAVKLFWSDLEDVVRELAPGSFDFPPRAEAGRTDDESYRRIFAEIAWLFPNPTFVFLARRDQLRQAVSLMVAGQTRLWRKFSDGQRDVQATYNFDQIVQRLANIQNEDAHWRNFFRANGLQPYAMHYEDLAEDYDATLRKLFAALGREDAPVSPPRLQKQADATSEELLQRFLTEFRARTTGRPEPAGEGRGPRA